MIDESLRCSRVGLFDDRPPLATVRASVVVPVYNRSIQLRRVLGALSNQTFPADAMEVLVCDDGSTEDIAAIVAGFGGEPRWVHLRQQNLGPGAARNLGLVHAHGEIVALTDSDCIPCATWLEEIVRPLADSAVGIVGGNIDYRRAEYLSGQCINFLMSSSLGAGGARNPCSAVHMKYYPRAGNMAVRRGLALAAGGFPKASHGEDLEFSHKVMQLGGRVAYAHQAAVVHNERRGLIAAAREAFKKGQARVRLATRHGMHEVLHSLPAALLLYLVLFCCASVLRRNLVQWLAAPGCIYLAVLAVLAIQGMVKLRSVRAVVLVPVYASAMHLGYGLGYLHAWLLPIWRRVISAAVGATLRPRSIITGVDDARPTPSTCNQRKR